MDVGCTHIQDTYNCSRSLQKRTYQYQWCTCKGSSNGEAGRCNTSTQTAGYLFFQTIEKRVGAKLVPEMMENITAPEQYELLEMSKISGFINRAKGTGRPTKKDRRELEDFTAPEFVDDFDFDFDFEE